MKKPINITGVVGSLRAGSYNQVLMDTISHVCPNEAKITQAVIGDFPLYNQDLEIPPPPEVITFKNLIKAADALLFVTPEYNYGVPGLLKNAIDWASRPYGQNSFDDKPAAIITASTGMLGGARAQYDLRRDFVFLNIHPINKPEVMVPFVSEKIKDEKLIDEHTHEKIRELLIALIGWTTRLNSVTQLLR